MNAETYVDHRITLQFSVQPGDTEGAFTEALFDAAVDLAPSDATGFVARADTVEGKVWITFTIPECSRGFAEGVCTDMKQRVKEAVLSEDDACVSTP